MQEQRFRAWLKDEKEYQRDTIRSRLENCRTVQRHEGDLDAQWEADRLEALLDRFSYSKDDERHDRPPRHRVPIGGLVYTRTAVLKGAIRLYQAFRDAQEDGKQAERSAADRERWGRYLEDVRRFVESGLLDGEVDFKLRAERQLQEARRAVLAEHENCLELVVKAFSNQLIDSRSNMGLRNWCQDQPDEAREALRVIWTEDAGWSTADRIRGFTALIPESLPSSRQAPPSGTGTRLRSISVLLMALGARELPPYKVTEFKRTYERTGHPQPEGDEAVHYEAALGLLDELIERAREAGLEGPTDRLEAQSVVFKVAYGWAPGDDVGSEGEPEVTSDEPHERKTLARADFSELADDVLYDEADLHTIARLLDDKRQVIFQGPPGTGKTYAARAVARFLAESDDRVTLVQFHPSYAYEDFVQGYRPTLTDKGQAGFELRDGPLVQAARRAKDEPDSPHFLIIDEINRGNLAKVFGELYFLLEYRDEDMTLQYAEDDESFGLPKNLYIIGTMNTADRSIALVDLALRRRFHFVEFHPDKAPIEGLLDRWLERNAPPEMAWTADVMRRANAKLDDRQAAIGPSYFMKEDLDEEKVRLIWEHNVLPYVEEHLYGETDRLAEFKLDKLRHQTESADADAASQGPEAPGESDDAEQD